MQFWVVEGMMFLLPPMPAAAGFRFQTPESSPENFYWIPCCCSHPSLLPLLAVKSIPGQMGFPLPCIHDMSEKASEIWGPAAQSKSQEGLREVINRLASDWQPTRRHCMSCWHYMWVWYRRGVHLSVALLCWLVPTLYLSWWMDGSWMGHRAFWILSGWLVWWVWREMEWVSEPGEGKAVFSFCHCLWGKGVKQKLAYSILWNSILNRLWLMYKGEIVY